MKRFLTAILLVCMTAALPAVEVLTVEGNALKGQALAVKDGVLSIDAEQMPLDEVRSCRWSAVRDGAAAGRCRFVLEGGDRLVGTVRDSEGDTLNLDSLSFGAAAVDLRFVNAILLDDDTDEAGPHEGTRDRIVFANGDALDGFVRKFSATGVIFESVVGKMHYGFKEVRRLSLLAGRRRPDAPEDAYFRLTTVHGEVISGSSIEDGDDAVVIRSYMLGTVRVAKEHLSRLEVVNGRLVFVSDLEAAEIEEKPFWQDGFVWRHRLDFSVDGNPLRIDGIEYSRGIGVHSFCRLVYVLGRRFERFAAVFGIDDEVSRYGTVDMAIKGDGKVLFERKAVRWDGEGIEVNVDVSEVDTLELVVDFGEALDIGDHADWGGAHLIRKR